MDEWVINQPLAASAQEQILSFQFGCCIGRSEVSEDPESLATAGVGSLNTPGQIYIHSPCVPEEKNSSTLPSFPEGKVETLEILLLNIPPGWTWSKS